MLNIYTYNNLKGNDYGIARCTCGFNEKVYRNNYSASCPNCNAYLINSLQNDELRFGDIEINKGIMEIKEIENKICAVEITLYQIEGTYQIDFLNKDLIFNDKPLFKKDTVYKIIFDGTLPENEMLKVYDAYTSKEISIQQIINNTTVDYYYLHSYFNNFQSLKKFIESSTYRNIVTTNDLSKIRKMLNEYKLICHNTELIIKSGIDPFYLNYHSVKLDNDKTTPAEMLGLKPYGFKYLKEHYTYINIVESLKLIDTKFGDRGIHYLNTFGLNKDYMSINFVNNIAELINKANLSINKLYKYLFVDAPDRQGLYTPNETLSLLVDTFNMCELLGIPFDKNPKALERYHDTMAYEFKIVEDELKAEQFKTIMGSYSYLKYENESDFIIMIPKESSDLIKEGKNMRHCVGSYIDKVLKKNSIIVFLRKKENIDKSFATLEINKYNELCQIKCHFNSNLKDPKSIEFIKEWCENNNIQWEGI